jgi:hypothetical protein
MIESMTTIRTIALELNDAADCPPGTSEISVLTDIQALLTARGIRYCLAPYPETATLEEWAEKHDAPIPE